MTKTIYDFGMNIAEDTEYYLKRGFRVIAIEANPSLCRNAAERFASEVESGQLRIVNKAIGDKAGTFRFYICAEMSAWSTASEELRAYWQGRGATFSPIEVEFVGADEVIKENGQPYFAKIDIEGNDIICLEHIKRSRKFPKYLSFEVDLRRYREALKLCHDMGYKKFALVDQKQVPLQRIPVDSLEGAKIEYEFKTGQSGLFGQDLKNSWAGYESINAACLILSIQGKLGAVINKTASTVGRKANLDWILPRTQTWYDVHAGVEV